MKSPGLKRNYGIKMQMCEIEKGLSEIQAEYRNISTGLVPSLQIIPRIQAGRLSRLSELMTNLEVRCSEFNTQIENAFNSAREAGFEKGFEQSLEKTMALISEAEKIKRETIQDASDEAMEMALVLAEKVIGNQVEIRPELLVRFMKEWLDAREFPKKPRLRMNPSDIEKLKKRKFISADLGLTADCKLPEGSCVIECNGHIIDAGVNARLDCILNEANQSA